METKPLKLTSLNSEAYSDIEIETKVVDNIKAYVENLLSEDNKHNVVTGVAKKTADVYVRAGKMGEEIDTRPRVEKDGKIYVMGETKNKVTVEGSMIVMNPDGEEYIVKPEQFEKRYKETNKKDIYEPVATPIKYLEVTEDIAFTAPWGAPAYAVKGAVLNITSLDDIYPIQNEAFKKTYTVGKQLVSENKSNQEPPTR